MPGARAISIRPIYTFLMEINLSFLSSQSLSEVYDLCMHFLFDCFPSRFARDYTLFKIQSANGYQNLFEEIHMWISESMLRIDSRFTLFTSSSILSDVCRLNSVTCTMNCVWFPWNYWPDNSGVFPKLDFLYWVFPI